MLLFWTYQTSKTSKLCTLGSLWGNGGEDDGVKETLQISVEEVSGVYAVEV